MNTEDIDLLGIDRVLKRGSGHVIKEDDGLLFVYDDVSEAYFLACDDEERAMETLESHKDIRLLMVSDIEIGRKIFERYGFKERLECYQAAYFGKEPAIDPGITIREADEGDLPFLTATYDLVSPEEMAKIVERKDLIIGHHNGGIIGFIGEHLEGSMGLLYILPEYRRKGYATALEKAFIARTIKKGLVPFGQIEKDNAASLELQKKLGMEISDRLICWMWK